MARNRWRFVYVLLSVNLLTCSFCYVCLSFMVCPSLFPFFNIPFLSFPFSSFYFFLCSFLSLVTSFCRVFLFVHCLCYVFFIFLCLCSSMSCHVMSCFVIHFISFHFIPFHSIPVHSIYSVQSLSDPFVPGLGGCGSLTSLLAFLDVHTTLVPVGESGKLRGFQTVVVGCGWPTPLVISQVPLNVICSWPFLFLSLFSTNRKLISKWPERDDRPAEAHVSSFATRFLAVPTARNSESGRAPKQHLDIGVLFGKIGESVDD